jgi:cobalt-zinc-cadmium efflux system membrane fusion protein
VPVYVGDREQIDAAYATVRPLAAPPGRTGRPAWAIPAPPAANPLSGTVDLFFDTLNPDLGDDRGRAAAAAFGGAPVAPFAGTPLSPGQRVAVSLTLKEPAEALTVPWSAVLYDFYGGAWVYVKTAAHTYTRERVTVRHVAGSDAVLDEGPPAGKEVVAAGAAELFGTETGFSK